MSLVVPLEEIFNNEGLLCKAEHWERVELSLAVSIMNGFPLKSTAFNSEKGFPVIRIRDLKFNKIQTYYSQDFPKEYVVSNGDLLVGMDGDFICYEWTGGNAVLNQRVCKLVTDENYLLKRFLFYGINGYLNAIQKATSSVTVGHLSSIDTGKIPFPLPPLHEQHRIVAKLDALFEKIESNKHRLDKIPKLLKRFRQSVLASAVNNDGKEEITKNVCEEIQIGPFGTQLHRNEYIPNGIPLVNPTHIQGGDIIPDMDLTITKTKFKELPNYHLKTGDVIMGRRGEMARCALVSEKENGWLCGTGSLFFRPNIKKINPQYLYWVLSNSITKAFLENEAKGSTMSNLNLNIVRNIPFPLPSLEEQKKIVKQVEQLFAFADKIEARYTKAKTILDKLPQSILAKAFRGGLVAQDPNDEPASILLERIKAEKAKVTAEKKGKKTKEYSIEVPPVMIAAERKG